MIFRVGLGRAFVIWPRRIWLDHYLEPLIFEANHIAEREERAREEADDYSHLSGLPAPVREPTSSLQLDPVQVMLVALDLVELRGPSGGGKQP